MPEKILIADDEHYVLEATVRRLKNRGYDVSGAESGTEALEKISRELFDLLLLDIKMPGISGLELLRQARSINPEIMAIIVTGYGSVENAIEAMELGALGFVRKPVSIEELSAAIEGALARGRLRRENARLKALLPLFELSKTLLSEIDEGELLNLILDKVKSGIGVEFAQLLLLDENGGLVRKAACGLSPAEKVGDVVVDSNATEVCTKLAPVVVSGAGNSSVDISKDSTAAPGDGRIYVPLAVGGKAIGILMVGGNGKGTTYQQSDVEFLSTLCGQGAIAISNVRLVESLERKQAEVERLLEQVVNTADNERLRLSLELHDGPIQAIVASQLDLKTYSLYISRNKLDKAEAKLESILRSLAESVRDLRRIVRDLHPPSVSQQGLVDEIQEYLSGVERNDGIRCRFEITGMEPHLDAPAERGIYYVVREALTNARKHSGATEIHVLVKSGGDNLVISVADNGHGFDPNAVSSGPNDGHLGMRSMKERAKTLGGTVDIRAEPGGGAVVTLFIPVKRIAVRTAQHRDI